MRIIRNETLSIIELNKLLEDYNWNIEPIEKLQMSLDLSWGWVTARDSEDKLVGFVQILSDGSTHAYIFRMLVHSDYRKQGVGTMIMNEVMSLLKENKIYPTLVASPNNASFYSKFGFKTHDEGRTAMCIRHPFWNVD